MSICLYYYFTICFLFFVTVYDMPVFSFVEYYFKIFTLVQSAVTVFEVHLL